MTVELSNVLTRAKTQLSNREVVTLLGITQIPSPKRDVYKVLVGIPKYADPDKVSEAIRVSCGASVYPVLESFREVTGFPQNVPYNAHVGFVFSTPEVKEVTPTQVNSFYKVVSGNVFMDETDSSLWVISSSGGKLFVTKKTSEDDEEVLRTLVESSSGSRSNAKKYLGDFPVPNVSPGVGDFAVFFSDKKEIDYGLISVSSTSSPYSDVFTLGEELLSIPNATVIEVVDVKSDLNFSKSLLPEFSATGIDERNSNNTPGMDKGKLSKDKRGLIEYYKKVYANFPGYFDKLVTAVLENPSLPLRKDRKFTNKLKQRDARLFESLF